MSFSADIYPIISANCAMPCHYPGYAGGAAGGLDMRTSGAAGAYAAIVNKPATAANSLCTGLPAAIDVVVAGNSALSLLYNKIASAEVGGPETFCGASMPIGAPLPPSSVALIKSWIDEGATP